MALVQIRLHSVLCWGRLITRDGVEREELGQSFALLCLACERALFMKSGKLMLFLTTSGISPVLFLLLPHTHTYTHLFECVYVEEDRWKEMVPIFLLLLHHTAVAFDIDGYRGFWVLNGRFDQRSLHGQHAFRRKGRGHLLNISWRGEAAREEYDTIRSEIRTKQNKTLLLSEKRISVTI